MAARKKQPPKEENSLWIEIVLSITILISVLMYLGYVDACGAVGRFLCNTFGLFGFLGYLFPLLLFVAVSYGVVNRKNKHAMRRLYCSIGLFFVLCALFQMFWYGAGTGAKVSSFFTKSLKGRNGGGLFGGLIDKALSSVLGSAGTYVVLAVALIILIMAVTQKLLFAYLGKKGKKGYDHIVEKQQIRHQEAVREREERKKAKAVYLKQPVPNRQETTVSQKPAPESGRKSEVRRKQPAENPREASVPPKPEEALNFPIFRGSSGSSDGIGKNGEAAKKNSDFEGTLKKAKREKKEVKESRGNEKPVYEQELEKKFRKSAGEKQTDTGSDVIKDDRLPSSLDLDFSELDQRIEKISENFVSDGERKEHIPVSAAPQAAALEAAALEAAASGVEEPKEPVMEVDSSVTTENRRERTLAEVLDGEPEAVPAGEPAVSSMEASADSLNDKQEMVSAERTEVSPKEQPEAVSTKTSETVSKGTPETSSMAKAEAVSPDTPQASSMVKAEAVSQENAAAATQGSPQAAPMAKPEAVPVEKPYVFPPIDLLERSKNANQSTDAELRETALRLQSTLESFGVKAKINNVSCGPSVTRYEIQPEQGVKVSKITSLSDDIKMNLAATEIRIEAPIPGKNAVGIEVPNTEVATVSFRELVESKEFKESKSKLTFGVGKDIGNQTIIGDIAKMPHMLIAGATGSGKSVCINTLIMSILYKASPEEVKLILIDPKVVELSIYNGIPHLLIPVVTDPKKALGALNWAVAEMTDRYNKFSEVGVRDLKGYNQKIKQSPYREDIAHNEMPQIVVIVDEMADLMMVAKGDVEGAIVRLTQLARAAGIHLIIATQRPSVDVITGLIKANVPSRIAFAVSSQVDSRTILDGAGAEKLLGRGDMLFYPREYAKAVRVQGAFVSDDEVTRVVEFIKDQFKDHVYDQEIDAKIMESSQTADAQTAAADSQESPEDALDAYFEEAGRMIIKKGKASIGFLQRVHKIGFNRAARIMDQLCEAGVVGAEQGTKPREILMTLEQFEELIGNMRG